MNLLGKSLGKYMILEQLGEGGMATVYKAFDPKLKRYLAIKVIRPEMAGSENFAKRFEREADSLAKLTHPNIVGIIDYGEQEGMVYLVMEYLPGGTLKQKTGTRMDWAAAAKLLAPIGRALEYAHQRGIVHRDVKPANILISESGEPMLSDFGIARLLSEKGEGLTATGIGIGTPEYMAPEHLKGGVEGEEESDATAALPEVSRQMRVVAKKGVDGRADVYSLGVVYYELVTGRKPFRADTPMAVAIKQATEPIPLPRQIAPDLPQNVEMVLLKALAKDPNDRHQSMAEFTNELEELGHAVGKGGQTQVLKDARKGKPPRVKAVKEKKVREPVRKRTGLWVGLGIGFVILAALGVFLLLGGWEYLSPTWSKLPFATHSRQVMSVCLEGGENQLCFTDPLTRSIVCKVSPFGGVLAGISISPDGQKIAVANGNSLSIRNLNNDVQTSFDISGLDNYYFSEWSPGMSKLLFVSYESDGSSEVYSVKVDGSASTQLTNTSGVAHSWEQWSPDGSRILATCSQGGVPYICTFDANGNDYLKISSPLTNDASITPTADWSPDSQRIVFTSSFNNTWDLNLMDANGEDVTTLLRDQPWEIHYPHFSADGTKIIFTAMDYSGSNAWVWIGMIDADGTDLTNLTDKTDSCTSGSWVP